MQTVLFLKPYIMINTVLWTCYCSIIVARGFDIIFNGLFLRWTCVLNPKDLQSIPSTVSY